MRSKLRLFEVLVVGVGSVTIEEQVRRIYDYQEVVANTFSWISTILKKHMSISYYSIQ